MFSEPPNPENKWPQLGDLVQDPLTSGDVSAGCSHGSGNFTSTKIRVICLQCCCFPSPSSAPRARRLLNLSQIGPIYFQFRSIGFIPFHSIFSSATQRS